MKKRTLRALLSEAQDQATVRAAVLASVLQDVNQISDFTGNVTVQCDALAKYLHTDNRFADPNAGLIPFRVGVIARRFLVWYDRYQQASARIATLTAETDHWRTRALDAEAIASKLTAVVADVCTALSEPYEGPRESHPLLVKHGTHPLVACVRDLVRNYETLVTADRTDRWVGHELKADDDVCGPLGTCEKCSAEHVMGGDPCAADGVVIPSDTLARLNELAAEYRAELTDMSTRITEGNGQVRASAARLAQATSNWLRRIMGDTPASSAHYQAVEGYPGLHGPRTREHLAKVRTLKEEHDAKTTLAYLTDWLSSTAGIGLPFTADAAVAEAVHLVSYARAHAPTDTCVVCLGSKMRARALDPDARGLDPQVVTEPCDNCGGTGETRLLPFDTAPSESPTDANPCCYGMAVAGNQHSDDCVHFIESLDDARREVLDLRKRVEVCETTLTQRGQP